MSDVDERTKALDITVAMWVDGKVGAREYMAALDALIAAVRAEERERAVTIVEAGTVSAVARSIAARIRSAT